MQTPYAAKFAANITPTLEEPQTKLRVEALRLMRRLGFYGGFDEAKAQVKQEAKAWKKHDKELGKYIDHKNYLT